MFLVQLACQHTTEESMLRLTLTYHVTEGTNRHAHTQNLINHMLDVLGWTTEGSTTLGTKLMKFMLHRCCLHPEEILGPGAARNAFRFDNVVMYSQNVFCVFPQRLWLYIQNVFHSIFSMWPAILSECVSLFCQNMFGYMFGMSLVMLQACVQFYFQHVLGSTC